MIGKVFPSDVVWEFSDHLQSVVLYASLHVSPRLGNAEVYAVGEAAS
jgi:hypothetical protein